jgi:hypothetical protein
VVIAVVTNCGYRGNHALWLSRYSRIVVTVGITHCGYRGSHELWLPWESRIMVTVGITHCGYCGVASCCVCIINNGIMGPSTQQFFFSSSDVSATTCFDHSTIIRRQTVEYCRKRYARLHSC